jgi:hypothetical protein
MTFRRVLDLENIEDIPRNINLADAASNSVKPLDMFGPPRPRTSLKRKRGEDQDEADEISLFRRVRIYNISHPVVLPAPLRSTLKYQVQLYELRNNDWVNCGPGGPAFVSIREVGHLLCFINKNFRHQKLGLLLTGFTTGAVPMRQI